MKWSTRLGAAMASALVLATVSVSVAPVARSTPLPYPWGPIDKSIGCADLPTPAAVEVPVVDDGSPVTVDLFLVLDRGVSERRARQVVDGAKESYAPLGIRLRVAGVRSAVLKGTDAESLIDQTARLFPAAQRPRGIDAVATLTSVSMNEYGMASCIGGVRAPGDSFLVVEVSGRRESGGEIAAGVRTPGVSAAKVLGHELGHLLGAWHHFGNCVEGAASGANKGEVSPCTLMFGTFIASMNFGTFESLVVRGYADEFARP